MNNLFDVYPRYGIAPVKAQGVYVYDGEGQKYLDFYGGHGVISIGHTHPHYVKLLEKQLNTIGFYSNSVQIPIQEQLAHKLARQSGYPDYYLFLCNSGAEANENAIKLASFHTGKKKIIAFKNSFHGRTAAALNVTDNVMLSAPVNRHALSVSFIDLNDRKTLHNALKNKDVCAVIIEGIQGVGGLNMPTEDYLQYLRGECTASGAMLIMDEIQSGYGRSGKFFAHQYANIKADIITIAKGMGNGFPVGGVLINPVIQATSGMLGTTFGGNYLACAAGIAVLDILHRENLMKNVTQVSKTLVAELQAVNAIKTIKGKGLMLGIEFDFPIKEIRSILLFEHHIFTGASANPKLLRILPPLNITTSHINVFVNALKAICP